MDQEDLSYRKWPFEDGFSARKQFKNPLQVQILEEAYEVNQNPTSRMKEDLARRTGLDFMQVQSWFGNRRYYDRHGPRRYKPRKDDDFPPGGINPGGGKSLQVNSEFDHPVSGAGPSLISGSLRASESCVFLNPMPLRSFMPPGTSMAMPVPPPTTQSHSFPMHQLHCVVTHAENELKRPLGDDTPVFANFKHLTSGGFQSPLVNMERTRALRLASQSCSPKKIQRAWLESNKPLTFSGTFECRCSTMSFNETAARVGDVHMLDVEHPRAVQEQQFFPQKSNWFQGYQNASHTHFPVSSVNTSHCRGQTSKGCAYASSSFPYQCETSNAANSSHQADDHPMPQLGNSYYSIPIENNFCSIEKEKQIHLDGSSKFQNFEHIRVSAATTPYQNRNQDCMPGQNQRRYSSNGLHHKRSYDRYIVMPRKGPETSVNGANQVSYFSNVDNNFRLIVAKWNSKEGRAVYTEGDCDITPSMSSGTDTTLSDDYHEEVTADVKDHAEGKSSVVINVDTESEATRNVKNQAKGKFIEVIDIDDDEEYHAGEYHNAQQSIVVWNGDGDCEMEDAGYKEDKDSSRGKDVGINEHVMASPVSSEHTL